MSKFQIGALARWCPTGKKDQWWHVEILRVESPEPCLYHVLVVDAGLDLWKRVWVGKTLNVFEKDLEDLNPLIGLAAAGD